MFHHQTKHLAWACSWLLELPSLRSRPQELGYFWNRIFFLRQSTFRPHEISESVLLSRRFYNNGNSHKIKRFNTSPLLVSLLFSFLCYSQSHPKFLPVLPVKTGLRAYALSRHMSRHTLNSHAFSLRHTEPHFFTTALQSGLGLVKMNPETNYAVLKVPGVNRASLDIVFV